MIERHTPQRLIQFVEAGQRASHDKALRQVYGVESWSALESDWRLFSASQRLRKLAQHPLPEARSSDQRVSVTEIKYDGHGRLIRHRDFTVLIRMN